MDAGKEKQIAKLIREAMERGKTPRLSRGDIERQRVSFAFGNSGLEHNDFTRSTVATVSEEMKKLVKDADGKK